LWNMAIWMEPGSGRKGKSVDAIKKSSEHPVVICAIGRLFWAERKIEKARLWLGRSVNADKDNGDLWAWWLKFERQHGEKVGMVMSRSRFLVADFGFPDRFRNDKTK